MLAHELGHFRLRHVLKRMAWSAALARPSCAARLAGVAQWFYEGLGVPPTLAAPGRRAAAVLLALPVFTFLLAPLSSLSRAATSSRPTLRRAQASAADLGHALVKLHEDNASTLTPDPHLLRLLRSHPPAALRIARLRTT